MGNITLSFTVQGDSEGYVTFECPYCGSEFKLQAGEVQSDEEPVLELFCPYCGLQKRNPHSGQKMFVTKLERWPRTI